MRITGTLFHAYTWKGAIRVLRSGMPCTFEYHMHYKQVETPTHTVDADTTYTMNFTWKDMPRDRHV